MSSRTLYLGKLLGIFCLIIGLAMVLDRDPFITTITALLNSPPMVYIIALFALAVGIAIILAHNIWDQGLLAGLITLIGWLSLAKGALLLFLPNTAASSFYLGSLHYAQLFYLYAAIDIALGLYLTITSFRSAAAS